MDAKVREVGANGEPLINIAKFLDHEGRLRQVPAKQSKSLAVLQYVAQQFCVGEHYTEKQVNSMIQQSSVMDCFLVRRLLVDAGYLCRERDGSCYWLSPDIPKAWCWHKNITQI